MNRREYGKSNGQAERFAQSKRPLRVKISVFSPEEKRKCQSQALIHPSLFPYRKIGMIVLMVIEWLVAAFYGMCICTYGVLHTIDIRGYLEYPCGFQCYLCFGTFLLYPLLLLCSLWKRIINIAKYGFLVIGSLLILSGISILATCFAYLGVSDTFMYLVCGGNPISEYSSNPISENSSLLLMILVSIWGMGVIFRYGCCDKYGCALFTQSLLRSYRYSTRECRYLSAALGIYIAAIVILWSILITHSLQE